MLSLQVTRARAPRCGTVLALHGLMESAATLARTAQVWTGSGWDVVTPDLRGHGRSPRWDPADSLHPGDRLVEDVLTVVDTIADDADPLAVFGHSAGAAVAAAVAVERLGRVVTVMLEDPFWRLPPAPTQDRQVATDAANALLRRRQMNRAELTVHGRVQHPDWSTWDVEQWAEAQYHADIDLVRNGDVIPTEPWPSLVSVLTAQVPVLVITGSGPQAGTTAEHRRMLTSRGAQVSVVEGANHFVRRDRPREFEHITTDWLGEHGPPRSAAHG